MRKIRLKHTIFINKHIITKSYLKNKTTNNKQTNNKITKKQITTQNNNNKQYRTIELYGVNWITNYILYMFKIWI